MRKYPLLIILFFSCTVTKAQKFRLGGGPIFSIPVGPLSYDNSIGIGAEITGSYRIEPKFEAFGQFGLHHFVGRTFKSYGGYYLTRESLDAVPILVGLRYVSKDLFAGLAVGYHTFGGVSGFAISPQVGYRMRKIDLVFHYTTAPSDGENLGYVGFKGYYYFLSK